MRKGLKNEYSLKESLRQSLIHMNLIKQGKLPMKTWKEVRESLKQDQNSFSLSEWLNNHAGCDVDKMMSGDKSEIDKMNKHFAKQTLKARAK